MFPRILTGLALCISLGAAHAADNQVTSQAVATTAEVAGSDTVTSSTGGHTGELIPYRVEAPGIFTKDIIQPFAKGGKIGAFGGAGSGKSVTISALLSLPPAQGEREPISGDETTGKTTVAIDTILNERDAGGRIHIGGADPIELRFRFDPNRLRIAGSDGAFKEVKDPDALRDFYNAMGGGTAELLNEVDAKIDDALKQAEEALKTLPKAQRDEALANLRAGLSGGQRQRMGLARAVVSNPKILMLDEPASRIDEFVTHELHVLFNDDPYFRMHVMADLEAEGAKELVAGAVMLNLLHQEALGTPLPRNTYLGLIEEIKRPILRMENLKTGAVMELVDFGPGKDHPQWLISQ